MELTHQLPEHDQLVSAIDGTGKMVAFDCEPRDFADYAQKMATTGIWRVAV